MVVGLDGCWENAVPDLEARARTLPHADPLLLLAWPKPRCPCSMCGSSSFPGPTAARGNLPALLLSLPMLAQLHSSS